jgi:hypothetical protein
MLFKVLARLSRLRVEFHPKITNLVRVFHENLNVTLFWGSSFNDGLGLGATR